MRLNLVSKTKFIFNFLNFGRKAEDIYQSCITVFLRIRSQFFPSIICRHPIDHPPEYKW
jgi:hypothetical protein